MPHLCVIAQVPEECPEAVAQLIGQCLEKEVGARPNARQVSVQACTEAGMHDQTSLCIILVIGGMSGIAA